MKILKSGLSQTQYGIYMECINDPRRTTYNLPFLYTLKKETDIERLTEAIKRLIAIHPALDTRIITDENGQICLCGNAGVKIEVTELSDEEFEIRKNELVRPFDLTKDILTRFEIYKTTTRNYLFYDFHHLIYDGSSSVIFNDHLTKLYFGQDVEKEAYTIFDIADEESRARQTADFDNARKYYEGLLDGYETDSTPVPDRFEAVPVQKWLTKEFEIAPAEMKNRRKSAKASTSALFVTALGFVIAKYNYTKSSVISTIFTGRTEEKTADTIAMMVKTIPFVTDLSKYSEVDALLENSTNQLFQSRANTLFSYMDMVNEFAVNNDINFAYHGKSIGNVLEKTGNSIIQSSVRLYDPDHIEDTKLLFEICDIEEGKYLLHMGYRADMYSDTFAEGIADSFIYAIEAFVKGEALDRISLLDSQKLSILDSFNDTDCAYDTEHTVVDLFRKRAAEYPNHTAVFYEGKILTYSQLDKRTDALALLLRNKGIGSEKVVAVLIPRCEYMVVAALGVLKAGGAYMPLDTTYPEERLNLMVNDSQAEILITTEELNEIITDDFKGLRLMMSDIEALDSDISDNDRKLLMECLPKSSDRFIMLYTSGSTGVPKGVILEHGNLMAFCAWHRKFYGMDESSRIAAYASFGFDANMHDIYPALTCGAAVYIISEDIRLDLVAVHEYFKVHEITHSFMTTQIGRQFAAMGNPGSLKLLSTGGEKLASIDPPDFDFYNAYGPTECTIFSTMKKIDKKYKDIPIGKMLDNLKGYVVDADGNRLPVGAAGELWISGPQVSREYLNRPEKTKEVYLDNPFTSDPKYRRCYKSGDVVRFLENGDIQFIGRRDGQIKVRGFRIELTEVEEVIRRFPGVKDVTAAAFDDPAGGKFICAYVVGDEKIDVEAMNQFIMEEKPPYMVPAVTMQIDEIPYNQNQKVNKKALPKPERKAEDITPPENDVQQKIFDIVSDIIGHKEFGVDTDIYLAGLTSIGVVRLNMKLSEEFHAAFTISDIKENSTVRKIEAYINSSESEDLDIRESYVLTKTQMGIFAECLAHPGSTIYNIPIAYGLDPEIDIERLKKAVTTAFNAHPYAMARLTMNDSAEISIKRDDSVCFEESMIEVIEGELEDVKADLVKPFDLLKDRLFRVMIITGSKNYLFIDMHHIISDGTSLGIILEDISAAYTSEKVEKESFSGFEVSLLEEKKLAGPEYEKAKQYYGTLLADADTECVPPRTVRGKEEASGHVVWKAEGSADELKRFCKNKGISMSTLFNAAFGFTLGKYIYKDDVLYTTIYNGRSDSRMSRIISMLVKTFPVRCEIKGEEKITDYLTRIGDQMMDSMANDIYSFAEISHDHNVSADILFTYQGELFLFDSLCGKNCEPVVMELDDAKAAMDIDVILKGDEIEFECNYRSDLFDEAFIEHIIMSTCKAAFEFTKKQYMREVSVLTDKMEEMLSSFNDTDFFVEDESVNRMFERQVELHPDRLAVIASGESLTYAQLNKLSNRAANALIKLGIAKDEIVGLISKRTKEIFIGEMAILKAGGAFLPMVPEYPDDRIDYCLTDADSRYVLTTEAIKAEKEALFSDKAYKVITFEELLENEDEENPELEIDSDALCYCIYTSGSTGMPKGVMIEQRNLRNFLDPNEKNPETANYVKYGHTVLSVISVSFDFSLMEIQLPLCNGLTVCMADEELIHDPIGLANLMVKYGVDVMACTPSFIGNMIDFPQLSKALKGMKLYDFGAEAFPSKLYEKLQMASPDAVICNGYGPTEATISCISKVLESAETITIGCPAANVKAYICDKDMNILPPGACGELVIGGKGVGRGYVKLPEKTAAVFVELNGERVYRSGDLVRILDNGEIEFFGRFDNQVKLRGFRVELDEIENNINTFDGINTSKVIVRNNGSEDYLAAFFTADRPVDIADLTEHLKEKLTYYMVPSVLMQLDEMPLTVNGKIDKKKLPSVEYSVSREYVEPEDGLEREICEIFGEILKQDKIGATDDFFEIGGTSLSATGVVLKLNDKGYNVVYKDIFGYSSPRELVSFIRGSKEKKGFCDDYDYSKIEFVLRENSLDNVDDFTVRDLGNIILTGASGFLGIHILKQFLDTEKGIAYCLIRKGKYKNPEQRLKNMVMYYFGSSMLEYFEDRIVCIDGDITEPEQVKELAHVDANVVINCAALVKHFVNDDSLDRINVGGVKNLIDMCIESKKRLIQISTTSVGGMLTRDMRKMKLSENKLYFGQVIDNDYIRTKFLAERAVLEARAERSLDGIVIRVGNLMSRNSDGEFQINFITNGFMRSLKAFKQLGAFPVTSMHDQAEFSPIDSTAGAILKLAAVDGNFCVYHADNSHLIYMSDVIDSMKKYGFKIDILSAERFAEVMKEASGNSKMSDALLGLIAYDSGDEEPLYLAESNNRFTVEVLYRAGYLWPITDNKYLYNVISVLDGFGFFELED